VILVQLFAEFFKTGLFAVGGGLATLPFIYDIADRYDWLNYRLIADMIAVSESTPGPIGINMSTYTGFHCDGMLGSAVATFALVLPSLVVIMLVARALDAFKNSAIVASVFAGLRPAATGLIAAAGFSVLQLALYNPDAASWTGIVKLPEFALFVVLFALIWKFKKHPIVYIAAAAAAGIILGL
jgi:chromate transporter